MIEKIKKYFYPAVLKIFGLYVLYIAYTKFEVILASVYPRVEYIDKSTDIIILIMLVCVSYALIMAKITTNEEIQKKIDN